jgi:hypothetical protein
MFDHNHYVPILKSKVGEKWALAKLKPASKVHVTPLFELAPIPRAKKGTPTVPLVDHLVKGMGELVKAWGTDKCYIDPKWFPATLGDKPLEIAMSEARGHGLLAIPVVTPNASASTLKAVAAIAKKDGRGVLIRSLEAHFESADTIKSVITAMELTSREVDLLIDYRGNQMNLVGDMPRVAKVEPLEAWREIITATGLFPPSLAEYRDGKWHELPRNCWRSWVSGQSGGARIPTFADYAIKNPGPPAGGGDPPVTLRYTTRDGWLIRVEGSHKAGQSGLMLNLCAELVKKAEYKTCGPDFSEGDGVIWRVANGTAKTGGPTSWVQWALNHHLEYVVHQLAARP